MALPATAQINIRSGATAGNVNGGGFNSARGGTDYTLQDAAQLTQTDGTAAGGTTFSSVLGGFTDAMKGNYLHITASTGLTVGWYEIVSVTDTNNVELDRSPGTGSATTFYVGGAMSLNSTLDDDLFEIAVAGNIFNIKSGSYTLGEAVSISAAGGAQQPIIIRGYTTTPGDACTGSNRPVISGGANTTTLGSNWNMFNISATGTGPVIINAGNANIFKNCKAINSSTTAGRSGFTVSTDGLIIDCEAVSYRGRGINMASGIAVNCWAHDSDVGIALPSGSNVCTILNCIVSSCVTAALTDPSVSGGRVSIVGNTLFGSVNTTGIGVSLITGTTDIMLLDNIITGFATGVSHADTQTVGYDDYNDFYNNDTDVSNWTKGANDSAVNPSFTNVGQVTGATATTTAGNHLVQSGATFITSGVVAGRDYVYIVSGTGVTAGIYGIASVDSETQITTDITLSANATADKVFQITTGQNFAVGAAMKALGSPGAFQGGYSTSYKDQGAVQRQETGGETSSAFSH